MRRAFLVLPLALSLIACGDKDGDDTAGSGGGGGDAANGELVYTSSCGGCHGASGGGEEETGVTGAADLATHMEHHSDAHLLDVIANGSGDMPAIGLSDSDADDCIAYMRAEWGHHE